MKELILDLYANDNFPIYLSCVIIVLMIGFFVVFFLGKKDQKKIEETQRLEKINVDAFKETTTKESVEIPAPVAQQAPILTPQTTSMQENLAPSTAAVANTEEIIPENKIEETVAYFDQPATTVPAESKVQTLTESVLPTQVPVVEPEVSNVENIETSIPNVKEDTPVIKNNFNEIPNFDDLAASIAKELDDLEQQQKIAEPYLNNANQPAPQTSAAPDKNDTLIDVPRENIQPVLTEVPVEPIVNVNSEIKPTQTKIVNGVFSSVYAPPKKVENEFEETMEIELPKLKSPVDEEKIHRTI